MGHWQQQLVSAHAAKYPSFDASWITDQWSSCGLLFQDWLA